MSFGISDIFDTILELQATPLNSLYLVQMKDRLINVQNQKTELKNYFSNCFYVFKLTSAVFTFFIFCTMAQNLLSKDIFEPSFI